VKRTGSVESVKEVGRSRVTSGHERTMYGAAREGKERGSICFEIPRKERGGDLDCGE